MEPGLWGAPVGYSICSNNIHIHLYVVRIYYYISLKLKINNENYLLMYSKVKVN